MDTFECIRTKFDVREFSQRDVTHDIKLKIIEAARLSGTGLNTQHWRFIVVQNKDNLRRLAEDSTSGSWVVGANFAVIVLTNPKYSYHLIDAGRALQNMQLTAWNEGVASGIFTGIRQEKLRNDFGIADDLIATVIIGFGYTARNLSQMRKNRMSLDKLVYNERYT